MISLLSREFGDFQTPPALAKAIFATLGTGPWGRLLEPTCGTGNFLVASRDLDIAHRIGIELQPRYAEEARQFAEVIQGDIFAMDLKRDVPWKNAGPLLVVGNPPWVTNAELTRLSSVNRPERANFRNLRGIEAMTGASNFDIAEFIWLKLIRELAAEEPTIAMLCKTQVARNVLSFCADMQLPLKASSIHVIDAKKWFNANVDACLFTVELGGANVNYVSDVYARLDDLVPEYRVGYANGRLVSNLDVYERASFADGECPLEWRQGIKHDATDIMELVAADCPEMKSGEPVDIESEYLYPLVKSTDLYRDRAKRLTKWMIVPQRSLADDTAALERCAPYLWSYLLQHSEVLDGRKSSIYRRRPRFCVFGIGDYTFARFKVAISGMHKVAQFRLVGPIAGRPVVFDDTCYFLSFDRPDDAAITCALLRSGAAHDLLSSLVFWDAKRPITKKLLQRLDLGALASRCDVVSIIELAASLASEHDLHLTSSQLELRLVELQEAWSSLAAKKRRRA